MGSLDSLSLNEIKPLNKTSETILGVAGGKAAP